MSLNRSVYRYSYISLQGGDGLLQSLTATSRNIGLLRLANLRLDDDIRSKSAAASIDGSIIRLRRRKSDHRWCLGAAFQCMCYMEHFFLPSVFFLYRQYCYCLSIQIVHTDQKIVCFCQIYQHILCNEWLFSHCWTSILLGFFVIMGRACDVVSWVKLKF